MRTDDVVFKSSDIMIFGDNCLIAIISDIITLISFTEAYVRDDAMTKKNKEEEHKDDSIPHLESKKSS